MPSDSLFFTRLQSFPLSSIHFLYYLAVSFIPNEFVNDAAHNISPIDAINYFCEIQFEDQLKKAREASVAPAEETAKSDRLRNTVVLLPKIDGFVFKIVHYTRKFRQMAINLSDYFT